MNIEIVVKTLWQGKVAVRQQYLEQALKEKKNVTIIHDRGSMVIKHTDIRSRIVGKTQMAVRDRFKKQKPGYLFYYVWKPDVIQEILI